MTAYLMRAEDDPIRPREGRLLSFTVDGEPATAVDGQTIAGALLAQGRLSWRTTRAGAPRGVFCAIGVCFDCLVAVGDQRDVRACLRRVTEGDEVRTQHDDAPTQNDLDAEVGA